MQIYLFVTLPNLCPSGHMRPRLKRPLIDIKTSCTTCILFLRKCATVEKQDLVKNRDLFCSLRTKAPKLRAVLEMKVSF